MLYRGSTNTGKKFTRINKQCKGIGLCTVAPNCHQEFVVFFQKSISLNRIAVIPPVCLDSIVKLVILIGDGKDSEIYFKKKLGMAVTSRIIYDC